MTTAPQRNHDLTIRMPITCLNGSGNLVARVVVRLAKPAADPRELLASVGSEVASELQLWYAHRTCEEALHQTENIHRDVQITKTVSPVVSVEVAVVRTLVLNMVPLALPPALRSAPLLPEAEDTQDAPVREHTPTPPTLIPAPTQRAQTWALIGLLFMLAAAVAVGYGVGVASAHRTLAEEASSE